MSPGRHHEHVQEALRQLRAYGLLLEQDALLPCITTIVAGAPVRGSWWGVPEAHGTYQVLVALHEHPEVLHTKLVSGKVTMVHRELWPAVLAVALARATWQLDGLSPLEKLLLDSVDREGSLQTDLVPLPTGSARKRVPAAARELERRLLVHGTQIHTPSGAHAKVLQTWSHWRDEGDFREKIPSEVSGCEQLEQALEHMTQACGASARLPWQPAAARKRA